MYYQYKLIKLLPKCDRQLTTEGWLNISLSALNNEYFTKSNRYWLKQLKESKLNSDFIQKCKADLDKQRQNLDPFKIKHFEPVWTAPLNSRLKYDELLEKDRLNKLNQKKKLKAQDSKKQLNNDLNNNLSNLGNAIVNQQPNKNKKRRSTTVSTSSKSVANRQSHKTSNRTPIKVQQQLNASPSSLNTSPSSLNTSPLSIGSITVRKTMNPAAQQIKLSNDQSPTNGKIFYISNNGKLLQIQQALPTQMIEVQNDQLNARKRKIDLDDSSLINDNNLNLISNDLNILNSQQQQLDNYLNQTCECEQKPLVICANCKAFCHFNCLNSSNICNNCLN